MTAATLNPMPSAMRTAGSQQRRVRMCECGNPATKNLRGAWQCERCERLERWLYPIGWAGRELKRLGRYEAKTS